MITFAPSYYKKFKCIADKCKDENFKKIYEIASSKIDTATGVNDSQPSRPVSFTDSEIISIIFNICIITRVKYRYAV